MTNKRISEQHHATFDSIRQQDEENNEFWMKRRLGGPPGQSWKQSCSPANQNLEVNIDEFVKEDGDDVGVGAGCNRRIVGAARRRWHDGWYAVTARALESYRGLWLRIPGYIEGQGNGRHHRCLGQRGC